MAKISFGYWSKSWWLWNSCRDAWTLNLFQNQSSFSKRKVCVWCLMLFGMNSLPCDEDGHGGVEEDGRVASALPLLVDLTCSEQGGAVLSAGGRAAPVVEKFPGLHPAESSAAVRSSQSYHGIELQLDHGGDSFSVTSSWKSHMHGMLLCEVNTFNGRSVLPPWNKRVKLTLIEDVFSPTW